MSSYLLDTNHLSPLVTLHHPLRARITTQMDQGDTFAVPAVVLAEFLFGIQIAPRAKANKLEWGQLQDSFGYFEIKREDAEEAANLQLSMRLQGRQVATIDALIATVAIRNRLTLLTTDRDFEFIPYLQRENWLRKL